MWVVALVMSHILTFSKSSSHKRQLSCYSWNKISLENIWFIWIRCFFKRKLSIFSNSMQCIISTGIKNLLQNMIGISRSNWNSTAMFRFHYVMVSGESLFDSRYWFPIILWYFLGYLCTLWGNHYFLVNNDLGISFSLVCNSWGSYRFGGVNIHQYTGKPGSVESSFFLIQGLIQISGW